MRNKKTTIAGIILAAFMGISQAGPEVVGPGVAKWATFGQVIAAGLLGVFSKDHNVTGGDVRQ